MPETNHHGGSFPVNVENAGIIGAVTVSGLPQLQDHLLVVEAQKPHGPTINGWTTSLHSARFGTDYLRRAVVALAGLGAHLPEDALYPRATVDARGEPLHGARRYVIRFPPRRRPPVNGFWSIAMYDERERPFADNPVARSAIGDRDGLPLDTDGSLPIYVQRDSPGAAKESNWLPAPEGPFSLVMRLYWPQREIVEGTWRPPALERIS